MYQHYYIILGIPSGSGLPEIKKAYRVKAKEFHPDLNKSSDAKEKFIKINEAYEFLINNRFRKSHISREVREQQYRDWVKYERLKARARAAYQAKKKFEQFKRSRIYKTTRILYTFYDFFFNYYRFNHIEINDIGGYILFFLRFLCSNYWFYHNFRRSIWS